MNLNKVMLIGRLGADPQVRYFDNGTSLARVSLATNEYYRDAQGQQHTRTQWHRVVFWGKLAAIIEKYATKGDLVYVEGTIRYSEYEDKDKNLQRGCDIHAQEFRFLGGGKSENKAPEPSKEEELRAVLEQPGDDELPF